MALFAISISAFPKSNIIATPHSQKKKKVVRARHKAKKPRKKSQKRSRTRGKRSSLGSSGSGYSGGGSAGGGSFGRTLQKPVAVNIASNEAAARREEAAEAARRAAEAAAEAARREEQIDADERIARRLEEEDNRMAGHVDQPRPEQVLMAANSQNNVAIVNGPREERARLIQVRDVRQTQANSITHNATAWTNLREIKINKWMEKFSKDAAIDENWDIFKKIKNIKTELDSQELRTRTDTMGTELLSATNNLWDELMADMGKQFEKSLTPNLGKTKKYLSDMIDETAKNSKNDSLYSQNKVELPTFTPSQVGAFHPTQSDLVIWEGSTPPSAPDDTITLKELPAIQNFSAFIKNIQDRVSKQPDHNNLSAATGQLICVLSYSLKQIACEEYIKQKIEDNQRIIRVKRSTKNFKQLISSYPFNNDRHIIVDILTQTRLTPFHDMTEISHDHLSLYNTMMDLGQAILPMDLLQTEHILEWAADDNIAALEMGAKIIIRALFTLYLMSNEELQTACKQINPTTHCYGTIIPIAHQILAMFQQDSKVKSFVELKEVFRGAYMSQISDSLIIDEPNNVHSVYEDKTALSPVLLKYVIANAIYQQAKKSNMDRLVHLFEKELTSAMAQELESFLYDNNPKGAEGWLKSICAMCADLDQEWDWKPIEEIVTESDTFSKELVAFFEQKEEVKMQNYQSKHSDWKIKYSNQSVTIEIKDSKAISDHLPIREYLRRYPSVFKDAVNKSIPKLLIDKKLKDEEEKYYHIDN